MSAGRILRIYLDDKNLVRAEAGEFNIMNKIREAFEAQEYRVEYLRNSAGQRAKAAGRRGYGLFYMDDPAVARGLTLRKAYFYPFWRIERSAQRWDWDIASAPFHPEAVDPEAAAQFFGSLRKRFFPKIEAVTREGFVLLPLQGRLLTQRRFQTQSPMDMIQTLLAYETRRDIILTLHPGQSYPQRELDALKALVDREHRLQLSSEPTDKLLARCDYVVTQNSSVALRGYVLEKPAVLFARIDFHHIAAKVADLGAAQAISDAPALAPDYAAYLHWFLKETAINGGSGEVGAQILAAVRHHGWSV